MNTSKENVTTSESEVIFTTICHENLKNILDKVRQICLSEPTGAVFTLGSTALGMTTISTGSQGSSEISDRNLINNEG